MSCLPHGEEPRQQCLGDLVGVHLAEVGKVERELGGGGEQILLAAEVPDDQGRVDADVGGDGAQRGSFVAVGAEAQACGGKDVGAGVRRVAESGGGHGDQDKSSFVDITRDTV